MTIEHIFVLIWEGRRGGWLERRPKANDVATQRLREFDVPSVTLLPSGGRFGVLDNYTATTASNSRGVIESDKWQVICSGMRTHEIPFVSLVLSKMVCMFVCRP